MNHLRKASITVRKVGPADSGPDPEPFSGGEYDFEVGVRRARLTLPPPPDQGEPHLPGRAKLFAPVVE